MRLAAIDCGTNSIRLLVVDARPDGRLEEEARRTTMVRLGQGVDATGEFHPDALARTFAACDDYAALIDEVGGVDRLRFVATSAARDAANSGVFFQGVHERFGVMPDIIAGAEEARLSFTGASAGIEDPDDPVLVIDIGGGSTELVRGSEGHIEVAESLDIGAVRLRERLLHDDPPTAEQVAAAREQVGVLLDASEVPLDGVGTFIGVAGTITTMGAVTLGLPAYDRSQVHRAVITPEVVHETATDWLSRTIESLRTIPSMHPQRAEIICAGALILDEITARVQRPLVVSESDILDGIALDLLSR
ncbi:Ppx/GppA phosphatase family protein [Aestuariimicrobium sp. Y1814]|uniref:Ppx/GppA phosphatase family protein n=1 Tax=Aestuariimicrobium sp. Y1814 TaxID=3418742 RepID=UPI003DA751E6